MRRPFEDFPNKNGVLDGEGYHGRMQIVLTLYRGDVIIRVQKKTAALARLAGVRL
jgi:hypothetical protein